MLRALTKTFPHINGRIISRLVQECPTCGGQENPVCNQKCVNRWEIIGEDDNADWGGRHIENSLGVVYGTYDKAVDRALAHPRFFTWGRGGYIKPYRPPNILH